MKKPRESYNFQEYDTDTGADPSQLDKEPFAWTTTPKLVVTVFTGDPSMYTFGADPVCTMTDETPELQRPRKLHNITESEYADDGSIISNGTDTREEAGVRPVDKTELISETLLSKLLLIDEITEYHRRHADPTDEDMSIL
jgi:hypothetical protein